jgi:two-component system, cell cycle sensor histidine kinase and response regulator CckA
MKILYKLNLMSLAIILAMTFLVLVAEDLIIKGLLFRSADKAMRLELSETGETLSNAIDRSGEAAIRDEAIRVQRHLSKRDDTKKPVLYVIEKSPDGLVYHSGYQLSEKIPREFVDEMMKQGDGSLKYSIGSTDYYAVFTMIRPSNWLVAISMEKTEILSQSREFLFAVGGILFVILFINAVSVRFFAKHIFIKRIQMVLDCLKKIETGDLSARISHVSAADEVGMLQEDINHMAAVIQKRALQQQEAEEALRKSNQMLNHVMENFPGVVFWKDKESVYLGCNRNFALGAGLTDSSEIVGKTDYDLPWAETEADAYRSDDRVVMESGTPKLNIVETQLQADGSVIWFDTNKVPLLDNNGKVTGVLGVSNDITKRKLAEEELKRSAEEIHDLFNRAPVGYHSLDENGLFLRMNDTELQWLGYKREEVLGRLSFPDILTPESRKIFENYFPIFIKQGWIRDVELEIVRKNGDILPVLISATAVTDSDGEFVMSRSTVYDISERKNGEQAFREIQEELSRKEKLAVLGQLAGTVGHEIRNPLGVMSNAVYLLKTFMTDADDNIKEYLDIIKQEIDNSLRIITDLLDFARTRSPHRRFIAVSSLINEGLKDNYIPKNVIINKDVPDKLPSVWVDPAQVGQVLQNLVANAVQAMPDGGALKIAARPVGGQKSSSFAEASIFVKTSMDRSADREDSGQKTEVGGQRSEIRGQGAEVGDQRSEDREQGAGVAPDSSFVEISVTDTGTGISPENMKKVFQPLFTTKSTGIGLGLVVCKNLVEANGGSIEVESVLGNGTTFKIKLPITGG